MKRLGSALLILVVLALPASADEFNSVVKGIESHYGIHRTHPHLINFALFCQTDHVGKRRRRIESCGF